MVNQLNRCYRKIPTILQIDPKTIYEELWEPTLCHIQQLQDGQNIFIKEEQMSMMILDLLLSTIIIYK